MNPFTVANLPKIEFGRGKLALLAAAICAFGRHFLLVTGNACLSRIENWPDIVHLFEQNKLSWETVSVCGEPSPSFVDEIAKTFADSGVCVVVAIGGGSCIDAGKAIAGLLPQQYSVMDYLEGVGSEKTYQGPSLPFIAVPTTAGTGSEATKNAVLSVVGAEGFKKSFRSEKLIPKLAILDPDLLASCPQNLIAANGMDAVTQLIEAYVSTAANVFTDALAIDALEMAARALPAWYSQEAKATGAMVQMSYAALISGICLAQTGLGSVHGLASPLGAFFPMPHGEVCGTLLAEATRVNIEAMQQRDPSNPSLAKYKSIAKCFNPANTMDDEYARLVQILIEWTQQMKLPLLRTYGMKQSDLDHVIAHSRGSSMKTNPIVLTEQELRTLLESRL